MGRMPYSIVFSFPPLDFAAQDPPSHYGFQQGGELKSSVRTD